jgi:hypothetical protein
MESGRKPGELGEIQMKSGRKPRELGEIQMKSGRKFWRVRRNPNEI